MNVETAQRVEVELIDLVGSVIMKQQFDLDRGSNSLRLEVPTDLPSGIYQVQIESEDGRQVTHKLVHARNWS